MLLRKLERKVSEVAVLTKKMQMREKQSASVSYGLRLLKTVSGNRTNGVCIDTSSIQDIPSTCISEISDVKLGEGRFGVCKKAKFHDYVVCIKVMDKGIDLQQILREAYFLRAAGSHVSIPHLFGVMKSSNAIVMSYHHVEGSAVSMYEAYHHEKSWINNEKWSKSIIAASQAILHIHTRNIIHNDIKIDNFVFGTSCNMDVLPVLVDFGKACYMGQGKHYKLTSEEKEEYKLHHSHLAPDVRDGICEQSFLSDVYSFGHLLYTLAKNKKIDQRLHLKALSKECMQYNAHNRPEMNDVVHSLTVIYKEV